MREKNYLFTSEAVTEGHPDKVCDLISDTVLDEVLKKDPKGRVACETFITSGLVVVGGEITAEAVININEIVNRVLTDVGYLSSEFEFGSFYVLNALRKQSEEIAKGVDIGGAGDQGTMFGYAVNETPEFMPAPVYWANRLAEGLVHARKNGRIKHLGPDGKAQLTFEYEENKPKRIRTVVVSIQHSKEVLNKGRNTSTRFKREVAEKVVKSCLGGLLDRNTEILINPAGSFTLGGPYADTGLTGRKIIADTYGGSAPHGGGAFSGKDPTKVDRSAAYMARYIAKNIVASGISEKCLIQISYAIGVDKPISVYADTFSTSRVSAEKIVEMIENLFNLTPKGIISSLNLRRPIYHKTATYGHFGRNEFPWEKTDCVEKIKEYFRCAR